MPPITAQVTLSQRLCGALWLSANENPRGQSPCFVPLRQQVLDGFPNSTRSVSGRLFLPRLCCPPT